jgi:cysteine-S-conjugate beta-lyase
LPSIQIRYRAADETARALARWLQTRPEVEAVLHPALAGAPGHEHWRQLCQKQVGSSAQITRNTAQSTTHSNPHPSQAAGLFSVVFDEKYRPQQIDTFVNALKLFKIGYSWGGHLSLAMPYDITAMRDPNVTHWPYRGVLVRLSIGFEAAEHLQADLAQALETLKA